MKAVSRASALEVEGLHKSYSLRTGVLSVLEDVSFAVAPGEFVALLGPSGSGKSTLLNILAGLERPGRGTVRVGGSAAGRPLIAYMQQKDLLLPWRTLWDNVLLAPEIRSAAERARAAEKAREWLKAFHLFEFRHAYPAQLSGGMRQRAALIRTLLCEREILLLDEPFGAVDALTRRRLQRHLLRVWETLDKTVILVTHDVEEAILLATRIVLLSSRPGRIVESIDVLPPHSVRPQSAETFRLKSRILETLEQSDAAAL